mgnify:CR=1 FL=1
MNETQEKISEKRTQPTWLHRLWGLLPTLAVFVLVVAVLVGAELFNIAPRDEETALVTTAVVGVSGGDTPRAPGPPLRAGASDAA